MAVIVGVFIWKNEAFLAYPKDGNIRQVNTILPSGVGEDVFFSNQMSFRQTFDHIGHFLEESERISHPGYILCIPDSFGMGEKTRILQYVRKCGISLYRMITRTMAMGLAMSFYEQVEEVFMIGYESGNDLLIGEYEYDNQILEKLGIYVFRNWREQTDRNLRCENNDNYFFFPDSHAETVYFAGSTQILQQLERRINETVLKNKKKTVKPYGEWNVPKGLAVYCAKLRGVERLDGRTLDILALDTFSPYPLCVAWKDEMFDILYNDTTIPTMKRMKLLNTSPDKGNADYTLNVFEKKGDRYILQGSIPLQKESHKLKGKGDLAVKISIDEKSVCVFSIESGENNLISFRADEMMQLGDTVSRPKGQVGSHQELLTSLLPVINNLSYGAKYSGEDNSYAKGMASIYDQTKTILQQQGIELIESTGVPFDIRYHHAVEHVTDPGMPPNTVKRIIRPGCIDHGEVIQPAYVVVAN